jgi:hypothetical protein
MKDDMRQYREHLKVKHSDGGARWKTLDEVCVESPLMRELRAEHSKLDRLLIWQVIGVTDWLAFLAVIVATAMR